MTLVSVCFVSGGLRDGHVTLVCVCVLYQVVYVTATMPYAMLLIMLVRGLTLPGAMEGIKYYLTPDFSRLTDIQVHTSIHCDVTENV